MYTAEKHPLNFVPTMYVDDITQSTALERKLNSKAAALTVLTEELEKCRIERDHLKIILENKMLHNTYNRVR